MDSMNHMSGKVKNKARLIDRARKVNPGKQRKEYSMERAEVALGYCKRELLPSQAAVTLDCTTAVLPSISASLVHAGIRRGDIEARMNERKQRGAA